ncbi:DUF3298 and DUF4163 domain-containing protein [Halalkalibacter alkalisediminis]|uniref:DUF3298 domain-containing protein n=1 Tax=Halalkalibacter alkalisediminis TaxID=935616 RepID=A0ABV6NKU6_9BACI|nr:DUF3298 and DUF4163 domain-containing protein [Halalkalibacter alkalisediminis]
MSKLEKTKKIYQSIETPTKLDDLVSSTIDEALKQKNKPFVWFKPLLYTAASLCMIFIGILNTSQAFAENVYDIPILGSVAQVFTFREYSHSDNGYGINVKVPAIEGTGHTELEKRINQEIQSKIDMVEKNAKLRAEENKQIILDEGGTEEDLSYFIVEIDYEIKSSTEKILSFVVNVSESFANTYTYQTFYNIDLETGKEITLIDILGENYKEVVTKNIMEQIKKQTENNPEFTYYVSDEGFEIVEDNLKFYINSAGNVVISFDKGEIAPPPMGIQEFEISN